MLFRPKKQDTAFQQDKLLTDLLKLLFRLLDVVLLDGDGTSLETNGMNRYFNHRLNNKLISLGVTEVELLTKHCAKSLTPFHPLRRFLIGHLEEEKKLKVVRVLTPLDILFRDSGHIKSPGDAYELLMKPVVKIASQVTYPFDI